MASAEALPTLSRPATSQPALARGVSSAVLRPRSRGELTEVLDLEDQARRAFIVNHRKLLRTAASSSRLLLQATRRTDALAARAYSEEYSGKDLKDKLRLVPPAADEVVETIATQLNQAMAHLWPQEKSQACYFKLFRHMDKDDSGLISLYEFTKMIRDLLKISPSTMSEEEVQGMWRWVDADASGQISSGEFLKLMRGGWAGFLREQAELRRRDPRNISLRKNWSTTCVRHPNSAWPEQTMSLEERRRFYVEAAHGASVERTAKLHARAREFEERAASWAQKLHEQRKRIEAAGLSTSRRGGGTPPANVPRRGTPVAAAAAGGGASAAKGLLGTSASAPVIPANRKRGA